MHFSHINATSKELLFEVYDDGDAENNLILSPLNFRQNNQVSQHPRDIFGSNKNSSVIVEKPPRFLGTAIVGIEELQHNFNNNHINLHRLNLHSHPYIASALTNKSSKVIEGSVSGLIIFEVS